jgi:nucleoside-diphosphate-sugar epimerase
MHVFVTGGSGWIGRGLVPELIAAGHTVTGLARSDATSQALRAAGAEVRSGSLDDIDTLRDAATSSDGVIHLAFDTGMAFSGDFAGAANADRRAIETFGEALAGTDKPFVIASGILGVLGVPNGVVATESDGLAAHAAKRQSPMPGGEIRMANADFTLALAERGVRSSIVRLAPSTHGDGDNGFIPTAIAFARQKGAAAYVGAGTNRWPTVHRNDAARLFRLAFESAPAGSVLHAVAEQGVPIREIAEAFAEGLDISAVSVAPEQAAEYVGFLGGFWGVDGPASAQITRDLLGWEPTRPGLIADLKEGHYFD